MYSYSDPLLLPCACRPACLSRGRAYSRRLKDAETPCGGKVFVLPERQPHPLPPPCACRQLRRTSNPSTRFMLDSTQVGHRQDTLRSIHTEQSRSRALNHPCSEESPRALRQKVPPVKVRSPRRWEDEEGFGLRFPPPRIRP